jgi:hypothetical protein
MVSVAGCMQVGLVGGAIDGMAVVAWAESWRGRRVYKVPNHRWGVGAEFNLHGAVESR